MKSAWEALVEEFKTVVGTKAFWFLLGLSLSGQTVPNIVEAARTIAGV